MIVHRILVQLLPLALLLASCAAEPTRAPTATFAPKPSLMPAATLAAPTLRPTPLQPTRPATATPTVASTQPPEGVFALQFYPPLVLEYDTAVWNDASEYNNPVMMVNYLQHREMPSCSIGVMGPSGFYPAPMQRQIVGEIEYDVFSQENVQSGQSNIFYFAMDDAFEEVRSTAGIPILIVQADPGAIEQCRSDAERALASLQAAQP